jgi:glycosyltransferase involved in cell wall biosynthesis
MHTPFISICIPAHNARRYLPETLAGVRAQTFPDWELIVTEDGSPEPVADLVHAFAQSVPKTVVYLRHEYNRGLPTTRNTGIAAARGGWIALLDSDDLWTPEHLASLVACATLQPAADLVHAGSVLFSSDTGVDTGIRAPSAAAVRAFPRSLYLADYIVQPSSVLMQKSLWARVGGFNPDYRYVEDREMWLRCARAGARFAYTGRNTCRYRKHAAAISTQTGPMALDCAMLLEQHLDWEAVDRGLRRRCTAEAWISAGRITLRSQPRRARDCFSRAWRIRRTPRTACYWLASYLFAEPVGQQPANLRSA